MTTDIAQLIQELLDPNSSMDRNKVIDSLAELGQPVVLPLLEGVKSSGYKSRRAILYKVFKKLGSPLNEPVLPYVAGTVLDVNHPGWDDAASILVMAGTNALPYYKDMISSYIQEPSEDEFTLQGIVGVLEIIDLKVLHELRKELLELQQITVTGSPGYEWVKSLLAKING